MTAILLALLGHALTLVVFLVFGIVPAIVGQIVVLVACLGTAVYLLMRGYRDLGRELIGGWLVGLVATPLFLVVILVLRSFSRCCY
jgi:hypothetical protein